MRRISEIGSKLEELNLTLIQSVETTSPLKPRSLAMWRLFDFEDQKSVLYGKMVISRTLSWKS